MNNGVQMERVLRSITSSLTRPARVHHVERIHTGPEPTDCRGPGAPTMRGWRFQVKGPNMWFKSRCFKLSGSASSTSYSVFFFTNSSVFGFYILLLSFFFPRRMWMFFKEYGCSKTERIPKWLGALSNALLNVHYKDE